MMSQLSTLSMLSPLGMMRIMIRMLRTMIRTMHGMAVGACPCVRKMDRAAATRSFVGQIVFI